MHKQARFGKDLIIKEDAGLAQIKIETHTIGGTPQASLCHLDADEVDDVIEALKEVKEEIQ